MLIAQHGDGFDFENNFLVANEVWKKCLDKGASAIFQGPRRFRQKRDLLEFKLNFQAFVVNRFMKTAPFVPINGKTCADDGVAFFLVNQSCLFV